MRIVIGTDHRGFSIRSKVIEAVQRLGMKRSTWGTFSPDAVDYPDIAAQVAEKVSRGEADRGILICGTGLGMCIAANKFHGVRAAPCHDDINGRMSRRHNDSNVLCLSADLLGERLIDHMIEIWLHTSFEGGRHARRVEKIAALEGSGRERIARYGNHTLDGPLGRARQDVPALPRVPGYFGTKMSPVSVCREKRFKISCREPLQALGVFTSPEYTRCLGSEKYSRWGGRFRPEADRVFHIRGRWIWSSCRIRDTPNPTKSSNCFATAELRDELERYFDESISG